MVSVTESTRSAETLSDILAETRSLQHAGESSLQYVLNELSKPAGILLVQSPGEYKPYLLIQIGLADPVLEQLHDKQSKLRSLLEQVIYSKRSLNEDFPLTGGVAVPVTMKGRALGVIYLEGDRLSDQQLETLRSLIAPIARSIRTWRLYQENLDYEKEFSSLRSLLLGLKKQTGIEAAEASIIRDINRFMGSDSCSIILLDERQNKLATRIFLIDGLEVESQEIVLDEKSFLADCLRSQKTVYVSSAELVGKCHPTIDQYNGLIAKSILYVPLQVHGLLIGALQLTSENDFYFGGKALADMELISNWAAMGISGMRFISQLKAANTELEAHLWDLLRSRNTLRSLVDSLPTGMYIIDRSYRVVAINLSCAKAAGKKPQAVVGKPCYERLHGFREICAGCRAGETFLNGRSTNRNDRRRVNEEEYSDWDIHTYPIYDDNVMVVQVILLENNVTEKLRLEGIVAQTEKLAAVGELAAGVAHDINNPLTAIIANAQMLKRDLPSDSELIESVELIEQAGKSAADFIGKMLNFSRKEQLTLAKTDINETVKKAVAMVQHEFLSRSISLKYDLASDLPLIYASEDHLQRVWLNLLLNAIRAIENRNGRIKVTSRQVSQEVQVSIADNGTGMSPERVTHIFEPFYTTKAAGQGTGLGLALCYRTIKQHSGRIEVDSRVGRGSTFTVALPLGDKN